MTQTFRVLVSSTFQDFSEERDALQTFLFPRIRELCYRLGLEFQAADLRWGVSRDAFLHHRTISICQHEIDRFAEESIEGVFVCLLGDRYGTLLLPTTIAELEFRRLYEELPAEHRATVDAAYGCDANVLGEAVRYLQPVGDEPAWTPDRHRDLCRTLEAAGITAGLSDAELAKYRFSVTHQEVLHMGALLDRLATAGRRVPKVVGVIRRIEGLPDWDGFGAAPVVARYRNGVGDRAMSHLGDLERALRRLAGDDVNEYTVQWRGSALGATTTDHIGSLPGTLDQCLTTMVADAALSEGMCGYLFRVIAAAARAVPADDDDPLAQEARTHARFGAARSQDFVGRDAELAEIETYLQQPSGRVLVVVGAPGVGKSALLARAVQRRAGDLVVRFAGVTADSSDERALVGSISQEIGRRDDAQEERSGEDLSAAIDRSFAVASAERPLVVVLDGLDQLTRRGAATRLAWIPSRLPEHVAFVVSTVEGRDADTLTGRGARRLNIEPLGSDAASELLDTWLARVGRTLQLQQKQTALSLATTGITPLWLRLAFEEVRAWRSDMAPIAFPGDVAALLDNITFPRLRAEHGSQLVDVVLAHLAVARNGLGETEFVEIAEGDLEHDGEVRFQPVLAELQQRSPDAPSTATLPAVVWSRLWADLRPYLSQRLADGRLLYGFYHRQYEAAAKAAVVSGGVAASRHRDLARYFARFPVTAQEPTLRSLSELPYQQVKGEQYAEAARTLSDFEFLTAKASAFGIDAVLDDLLLGVDAGCVPSLRPLHELLEREAPALRDAANAARPELLAQQVMKCAVMLQLDHLVEPAERYLTRLDVPHLAMRWTLGEDAVRSYFFRAPGTLTRLTAVTADGRRAVFGMNRNTWTWGDFVTTREYVEGRATTIAADEPSSDFALSADGKRLLIGSGPPVRGLIGVELDYRPESGTVMLWDLETSEMVWKSRQPGGTWRVRMTPEGDRAVSAGLTVIVWDVNTGQPVFTLPARKDGYRWTVISPGGDTVTAETSEATTARYEFSTWDVASRDLISNAQCDFRYGQTVVERGHVVAVSPSGRWAMFGAPAPHIEEWSVQVWDLEERRRVAVLKHGKVGKDLAGDITDDGTRAMTGSTNGRVILWDLRSRTGRLAQLPAGYSRAFSIRGGREAWFSTRDHDHARVSFVYNSAAATGSGGADDPIHADELRRPHQHGGPIEELAITPDGSCVASGAKDGLLQVRNLNTGGIENFFGSPFWEGASSSRLAIGAGPMAVFSSTSGLRLRSLRDRGRDEPPPDIETRHIPGVLRELAFSPDGRYVVAANYGVVHRWDLRSPAHNHFTIPLDDNDWVKGLVVTPDGLVVVQRQSSKLSVYALHSGEHVRTIPLRARHPTAIALMPSGHQVMVAFAGGELDVVDLEVGGENQVIIDNGTGWITSLAVRRDGTVAAVAHGDQRCVTVWDIGTRSELAVLALRTRPMRVVLDGTRLVAGDDEGALYCMDFVEWERTYAEANLSQSSEGELRRLIARAQWRSSVTATAGEHH
jgi:WD40 repeat protein